MKSRMKRGLAVPRVTEGRQTRTGGRPAIEGVIQGRCSLSVGNPAASPPPGWQWIALSDVARLESGHTPSRNKPEYWNGDVPWNWRSLGAGPATGTLGRDSRARLHQLPGYDSVPAVAVNRRTHPRTVVNGTSNTPAARPIDIAAAVTSLSARPIVSTSVESPDKQEIWEQRVRHPASLGVPPERSTTGGNGLGTDRSFIPRPERQRHRTRLARQPRTATSRPAAT